MLIKQKKYDVGLIKFFDRVHNIQTLGAKSPEKARKIIEETLKSFLVLSEVLEMPLIADLIYKECYKHNIKFNIMKNNNINVNSIFNFSPFAQNKILP